MKQTLICFMLLVPLCVLVTGCRTQSVTASTPTPARTEIVIEGLVPFTEEDLPDLERRADGARWEEIRERVAATPVDTTYLESGPVGSIRVFGMRLPDWMAACRGCRGCVIRDDTPIRRDFERTQDVEEERPGIVLPLVLSRQGAAGVLHWRRLRAPAPPAEEPASLPAYPLAAQVAAY